MADDEPPAGRVAWVTGASRGVGRGVAIALGRVGWTVYVTARSSAAGRTGHLPGTVEVRRDVRRRRASALRRPSPLPCPTEQLDLTGSQSPEGVGRAIAALAEDPDLMTLTGQALPVDFLASRYGVDVTS